MIFVISGQDSSRDVEFSREALYFAVLTAEFDLQKQYLNDHPWIRTNSFKIATRLAELEPRLAKIYGNIK